MSRIGQIAIVLIIAAMLLSAGCTFMPSGRTTPTPTPAYGTLVVTSNPLGAKVTLDGVDRGYTPLTLRNVSSGKHNITLSFAGYNSESAQVDVAGGQEVTFSRSLGEADPRIEVKSATIRRIGCDWRVEGALENTGNEAAKNFVLTLKMDSKDNAFPDVERSVIMGDFPSGVIRTYLIEVAASCATGYTGELKWEYLDGEGEKHSGSRGL